MADKLTEEQERERATWQYRAIAATKGNTSRLGCILLAVLGRNAKHPPWFGANAVITSDGYVLSHFTGKDGVMHYGAFVGSVNDLVKNFRGLAEHLKLSDKEQAEMFVQLQQWIQRDYRIVKEPIK